MVKIYSKLLFIICLALGLNTNAQCSGCTSNVTGLDAGNHIIGSGQTLCVASTGTMTGLITISAGGTLCNSGKIQSTNLWVAGGTLKNYGTIDTYSVLVSSAGTFTNYATALIDSLMITQNNSTYVNNGTQTGTAFTTSDHATTTNNGSITVMDMWDSIATFNNNSNIIIYRDFGNAYTSNFTNDGQITVTRNAANSYTTTFTNHGNYTVNNDFANSYSSTFYNSSYMKVTRDFYNSTSATFHPNCMMQVDRDWYNSAYVYGPTTSCGGFAVTGLTYNSGVIGFAGNPVDMCDNGHPAGGLDGNTGTVNANTTYCSCSSACAITGIKELSKESSVYIDNIFPNPASSKIIVKFINKESEKIIVEVRDMMGKIIMTDAFKVVLGINETEISVSSLAPGTYVLSVTDSHQLQTKHLFTVAK